MTFFLEVLIGGLLAGFMYSLVALGFVLIYKASGVFNFAQGGMVFFAALTFVGFQQIIGMSFWLAFLLTLISMIILGILTILTGAQMFLASMHQIGSIALISFSVYLLFLNNRKLTNSF